MRVCTLVLQKPHLVPSKSRAYGVMVMGTAQQQGPTQPFYHQAFSRGTLHHLGAEICGKAPCRLLQQPAPKHRCVLYANAAI